MPDGYATDVLADSGEQSPAGSLGAEPVDDAAKEVPQDAEDDQSGVVASVEAASPGWDEALAYADYLHTDAVLLVLGMWICAGIMLARLLLDRVVP